MAAVNTYDLGTPIGQVRLLTNDTNLADVFFSDDEYNAFLSMVGSNVQMAAAVVYGTIIRSRSLLAKYSKREGYESDSHAVKDLLATKKDLEDQANTVSGLSYGTIATPSDVLASYLPMWVDPRNPFIPVDDSTV